MTARQLLALFKTHQMRHLPRHRVAGLVLWSIVGMNAVANDSSVSLWSDVSSAGNLWTVVPHISGPAHHLVKYEITANKSGGSGTSQTRQAGYANLSQTGTATLANLTMSIGTNEECDVEIKLFDGNNVIEAQRLTLPQRLHP